jgi:hypothetical protein
MTVTMALKRLLVTALFLLTASLCHARHHDADAIIAIYDSNHDLGLDLAEVRAAGGKHFDTLNRDGDTTLEMPEVLGIVGPRMFAWADRDHDGSLSKEEYLALVGRLFRRADTQHFGRLYSRDLRGKAAQALLELIE